MEANTTWSIAHDSHRGGSPCTRRYLARQSRRKKPRFEADVERKELFFYMLSSRSSGSFSTPHPLFSIGQNAQKSGRFR